MQRWISETAKDAPSWLSDLACARFAARIAAITLGITQSMEIRSRAREGGVARDSEPRSGEKQSDPNTTAP